MGNDLNTSMGVTALYDVLKAKTNDATKLAAAGRASTACWVWSCWRRRRTLRAKADGQPARQRGGYTVISESGEERRRH